MITPVLRWALLLGALLAAGPVAYALTRALHDADGGHGATLLVGASASRGLLAASVVAGLATVFGVAGARYFNLHTGMTAAGFIAAWGAWGLGTVQDVLRQQRSPAPLAWLGAEGLLTAGFTLALVIVLRRLAKAPAHPPPQGAPPDRRAVRHAAAVAAGVAAGAVALWVFCVTPLKGQTVVCASLAALFAAAACEIVAVSLGISADERHGAGSLLVLAVAAPFVARVYHGGDALAAVLDARFLPVARPLSLDWAAGVLIGGPIGVSWAASMLEKKSPAPA